MRRFRAPSPAMVVALIALFVALGGTGYAARNVILSSPSKAQIIKIVKGVAPKLSVKSAAGLSTLPSGKSESGMFSGSQNSGWIGLAINYPRPLPAAINDANIIDVAGTSATHCPGAGKADPGYLCLYDNDQSGLTGTTAFYSSDGYIFPASQGKLGVVLYWVVTGAGYVGGSWTVTAP